MGLVKCQRIVGLIEELAPKKLAESWDNVGLLVGDGSQPVKKLMVSLDVPEWVVDEAIEKKVDLIVAHHPIIFSGLKRINSDSVLGRKLLKLIKNDIAVYCTHTNYDFAKGGLNDVFARQLGLTDFTTIEAIHTEKLYKIAVYVPKEHVDKVRDAMTTAGAGFIGKYSSCTFRTEGLGTFKGEEGSNPYIGEVGKLETAEEYKLETIAPEKVLNKVIAKMQKAHPYEEAAYDVYPLHNQGDVLGLGRLSELSSERTLAEYAKQVKESLGLKEVRFAGNPDKKIKKVAVQNGCGNKFASSARFAGADVLVTGDMQYHEITDALEAGLCIIDAGHYATEKIMIKSIAEYLSSRFADLKYNVEVIESVTNTDPIKTI